MNDRPTLLLDLAADWASPFGARFVDAIGAIDAVNAADPETVDLPEGPMPVAVAHATQMVAWVRRLDPSAGEAQLLAARAHHLGRWRVPRSSYPEGRAGYLRWRTDRKRGQADETAALLAAAGYTDDEVAPVVRLLRKEGLGVDPATQTHEDALCLVFVVFQFGALTRQLGTEHMVAVVRKTIAKMSARAIDEVLALPLDDADRAIVLAAAG